MSAVQQALWIALQNVKVFLLQKMMNTATMLTNPVHPRTLDDDEAGGFDLTCEAGFDIEDEDNFDVAKVLHNFLETEDGKEFMKNLKPEVKPKETKHEHYFKNVSQLDKIDVYAVLRLFEVTDPCIQHAVKKLLCTGKRGHKDFQKDIQDSIDSLVRCQELHNELNPELNQGNQDA